MSYKTDSDNIYPEGTIRTAKHDLLTVKDREVLPMNLLLRSRIESTACVPE
jgi:hypothetical protein